MIKEYADGRMHPVRLAVISRDPEARLKVWGVLYHRSLGTQLQ
jgi:hypothetical protein